VEFRLSLESEAGVPACATGDGSHVALRRKVWLSVAGALAVTCILGVVLGGRRREFVAALNSAPISLLGLAAVLQILALLARSEAWLMSVRAAGGRVSRRLLFRAAGVGYLASVINGSVGMAARIASLRRAAPQSSPRVPALLAAEVPIIAVEVALAAVFSFTLVAPLGIPWWIPAIAVGLMAGAVVGLRRLSRQHRMGLWTGLAVLRKKSCGRLIAFTLIAVCLQVARNWLMLRAIGENVSIFDAMALLIAMFTLGQLPIGPSIGPAAAVLILGTHGVADGAAAGVLLAVTGTIGSIGYATWALIDRLAAGQIAPSPEILAPAPPIPQASS
jgi:uncharacterized membrane protein YbhN (UPF0104 family)